MSNRFVKDGRSVEETSFPSRCLDALSVAWGLEQHVLWDGVVVIVWDTLRKLKRGFESLAVIAALGPAVYLAQLVVTCAYAKPSVG